MKTSTMIGVGAILAIFYFFVGNYQLNSQRNTIDGLTGQVWNDIGSAVDKIAVMQNQVEVPTELVADVMQDIAAARNDILAARESDDLQGALDAAGQAQVEVQFLQENYPTVVELGPLYTTLMDETSSSFNVISRSRRELINAQVDYNNACLFFFLSCPGAGGRITILGSDFNPASSVNIEPMGQ